MSARQVSVQERVDGSVGPPKQATALKKSAGSSVSMKLRGGWQTKQNTAL